MNKSSSTQSLNVIARAPFHVYFDAEARSISATNRVGAFDILPGHADFFSILSAGEITIETTNEPVRFTARNGIMTVRDNQVMLFVNI